MSVELSRLSNGVRVVTHEMPHLESAALGAWIASGARCETAEQHGISHLLEHMAFKGTASRSARQIAEEIENVGGEINAATAMEMTAYYARVLRDDVGLGLDIIADIIRDSRFDDAELERERDVIIQEIASYEDSPDDIVHDLAQDAAWPEQPVGRTILGTADVLQGLTSDDLRKYLEAQYTPERIVISAAGRVEHTDVVRRVEALFGDLAAKPTPAYQAASFRGGRRRSEREFEQAHVVLGFQGPSFRKTEFYTTQVMAAILGGGMSSRLFQSVREERGLCYAIYAYHWALSDTGFVGIDAATSAQLLPALMDVVMDELLMLASDGPSATEMARARAQLRAGLLLALESPGTRAEQLARNVLVHDRVIPADELIGHVDSVSPEGVRAMLERVLTEGTPVWAEVGTGRRASTADQVLARLLRH